MILWKANKYEPWTIADHCMDQPHSDNEHKWDRCLKEETLLKNLVKRHDFRESSTVFDLTKEMYGTKQI